MAKQLYTYARIVTLVVALFILLAYKAVAQGQGGIIDGSDWTVTGIFQPIVADAIKLSDRPIFSDSTKRIEKLNYSIRSKKVNSIFEVEPIKPAKMQGEPLTKLYRSMVKVGAGNYFTPYGEYFYNSLRSKDQIYGMHLKHISSQTTLKNVGLSSYSDNEAGLYGEKFFKTKSLAGSIDYTRNAIHYYGYHTDQHILTDDATFQAFTHVEPQFSIKSFYKDSSKVNYDFGMKYYYHGDAYGTTESNFKTDIILKTYYQKQLFTLNSHVDYYNNVVTKTPSNNILLKLNPSVAASGEKWTANLGLSVFMDITQEATKFKFYPNINFHYHIIDNIFIPYAGITGGLQKNSFYSYFKENPFINSKIDLSKNTDNKYTAFGGIRGTLTSKIYYNTKASFSQVKGLPLFVNDLSDVVENKFNVVYDTANVFNVYGEIGYQQTEKLRIALKGNFNRYTLDNQLAAWHKPGWEVTFSANYNLSDKIVAKADIFYVGKRSARTYEILPNFSKSFISTDLKAYTDINLGLEYRYTKRLGAFLNINNLAATRYYKWNGYPSMRFNVLLGVSYSF